MGASGSCVCAVRFLGEPEESILLGNPGIATSICINETQTPPPLKTQLQMGPVTGVSQVSHVESV